MVFSHAIAGSNPARGTERDSQINHHALKLFMTDHTSELPTSSSPGRRSTKEAEDASSTPIERNPEFSEIAQLLQESCLRASFSVLQLARCDVGKTDEGIFSVEKSRYGDQARENLDIIDLVQRHLTYGGKEIKRRMNELDKLLLRYRVTNPNDAVAVGTGVVAVFNAKDGNELLVFLGSMCAEMGSWRGGRSSPDDSLALWLKKGTSDTLLQSIDTQARGYDPETGRNYEVLKTVIDTIFPAEVQDIARSRMFHRQEFHAILDKRHL